jgi:hypothetical protein
MKKVIFATLAIVLLAVVAATGLMFADRFLGVRTTWLASWRLARALDTAREVVLTEYVGEVEIARKVARPDEISRLRKTVTIWPRPFDSRAFLCFEPHHSIEIVRSNGSKFECNVCFLCEQFATSDGTGEDRILFASLPAYMASPLASFFTSMGMAPKTDKEYTDIAAHARKAALTEKKITPP